MPLVKKKKLKSGRNSGKGSQFLKSTEEEMSKNLVQMFVCSLVFFPNSSPW